MKYGVKKVDSKAQPVAYMRKRCDVAEMPRIIGESYSRIMGFLVEEGEQPAGMPYTAYYNMDMKDLDVEMGFPTIRLLDSKGDVMCRTITEGLQAELMHEGPYSSMSASYIELDKWMQDNGYERCGPAYEYYFNSPQEVEEAELLTKIVIPIRKK